MEPKCNQLPRAPCSMEDSATLPLVNPPAIHPNEETGIGEFSETSSSTAKDRMDLRHGQLSIEHCDEIEAQTGRPGRASVWRRQLLSCRWRIQPDDAWMHLPEGGIQMSISSIQKIRNDISCQMNPARHPNTFNCDIRRPELRSKSAAKSQHPALLGSRRHAATACLHGLAEAAVLAAGYAPAIEFLHTGKPLSFVYDVADLWKTKTVGPEAFRIAGLAQRGRLDMPVERSVRMACRDSFRRTGLLSKIIPGIDDVLRAGDLPMPSPPPEASGPAFVDEPGIGDDGHRG